MLQFINNRCKKNDEEANTKYIDYFGQHHSEFNKNVLVYDKR